MMLVGNGFSGDVAVYYARFRRGYPPQVIDAVCRALRLTAEDVVLDLGCGTGQLALPLSARVRRVVGVDPEPDMLRLARESGYDAVDWGLGTSADVPELAGRFAGVSAITLANAIHLVDRARLFAAAKDVLPSGGSLGIIANGTPLWFQDADWSRAVNGFMERELGQPLTNRCGLDDVARDTYRRELETLGFAVQDHRVDYTAPLSIEQIVGGVFSAMSERIPPPEDRDRFAADLAQQLPGGGPFLEHVPVRILAAIAP
jgi:SAM-dependent methyltransferase